MCLYFQLKVLSKKSSRVCCSANWLHLLTPLQRDAVSNKVYRSLTDTTGKIAQNNNGPIRITADDPSTLDMVARAMPSLSTRQIIAAIGDKIVRNIRCDW